jgi:hypothetical protein
MEVGMWDPTSCRPSRSAVNPILAMDITAVVYKSLARSSSGRLASAFSTIQAQTGRPYCNFHSHPFLSRCHVYHGREEDYWRVSHIEDNNQVNMQTLQDAGDLKTTKVVSIALADALAKDNPSPWSWSMIQLYAIIVLVTMS